MRNTWPTEPRQHRASQAERWERESAFFDSIEYSKTPLPAATVHRYMTPARRWLPQEYVYTVLGDLHGKRVLEIGCGAGENSLMLALKGAQVVGVDLSSRAIDAARRRAQLQGVADSIDFHCGALETYHVAGRFDVICGWAILHHLIPELGPFLARLRTYAGPETLFLFVEPVNLAPWLRRLRLALMKHREATPDERPLEKAELELIQQELGEVHIVVFKILMRFSRFILRDNNYELSSIWRRGVVDVLGLIDRVLFLIPGMKKLASTAAIAARVTYRTG